MSQKTKKSGEHIEDPTIKEIAAVVQAARRQRGWTQKELAAKAGVDQSKVSRLESGKFNTRMVTLTRVLIGLKADLTFNLELLPLKEEEEQS